MNNCQVILENADQPDLLTAVIDVVLHVSNNYPTVFARHFKVRLLVVDCSLLYHETFAFIKPTFITRRSYHILEERKTAASNHSFNLILTKCSNIETLSCWLLMRCVLLLWFRTLSTFWLAGTSTQPRKKPWPSIHLMLWLVFNPSGSTMWHSLWPCWVSSWKTWRRMPR